MVYGGGYISDEAWYMDGGTTEHMTDKLEWFASLEAIPQGRWSVMIVDNRRLWVRGVGHIKIRCLIDQNWEIKPCTESCMFQNCERIFSQWVRQLTKALLPHIHEKPATLLVKKAEAW
jgi:hypothetical protein